MGIPSEIIEFKEKIRCMGRQPEFDNIVTICEKGFPTRPTPFEFIINDCVLEWFAGRKIPDENNHLERCKFIVDAYKNAFEQKEP